MSSSISPRKRVLTMFKPRHSSYTKPKLMVPKVSVGNRRIDMSQKNSSSREFRTHNQVLSSLMKNIDKYNSPVMVSKKIGKINVIVLQ